MGVPALNDFCFSSNLMICLAACSVGSPDCRICCAQNCAAPICCDANPPQLSGSKNSTPAQTSFPYVHD